jgi:glucose-6-phosphate isomerase
MWPKLTTTLPGIALDLTFAGGIDLTPLNNKAVGACEILESGSGAGAEFLGWLDLPVTSPSVLLEEVRQAANTIQKSEALVVVGVGGSYLGARAVIQALVPAFEQKFPIYFAGNHLDADYHAALLSHLSNRRYAINIISKGGSTTEPGIAARLLLNDLSRRFSNNNLKELVFITTDARRGNLRRLCNDVGFISFIVPDNVGGRFSVLTPVGLLPIAVAGLDIRELLDGARVMMEFLRNPTNRTVTTNPALAYAALRYAAYGAGKKVEVLASYTPRLIYFAEWWKQLFGESEGKERKGLFPASANLTSDLHSLGQWLQEGDPIVLETVLDVLKGVNLEIPSGINEDGFGQFEGCDLHEVNRTATIAALRAHQAGEVPCSRIEIPRLDERNIGALLFFFEYACAVSAYMIEVNPFDQTGVEAYKREMRRLLNSSD